MVLQLLGENAIGYILGKLYDNIEIMLPC